MDDGLVPVALVWDWMKDDVLILVVVDDGLVLSEKEDILIAYLVS